MTPVGDFLRVLLDSIHFLWPFRIVQHWERAGYYIFGRWWREVGPGLYVVVPFFTDLIAVNCATKPRTTGREDITLKNGAVLSFAATATVRVVDVYKALNNVDDYHQSTEELVGSFLAEQLADVDPERLEPSKRKALFRKLQNDVAGEAAEYGVEVTKLRFTSFVTNLKTVRLLMDQGHKDLW